jgi:hypothetical protein
MVGGDSSRRKQDGHQELRRTRSVLSARRPATGIPRVARANPDGLSSADVNGVPAITAIRRRRWAQPSARRSDGCRLVVERHAGLSHPARHRARGRRPRRQPRDRLQSRRGPSSTTFLPTPHRESCCARSATALSRPSAEHRDRCTARHSSRPGAAAGDGPTLDASTLGRMLRTGCDGVARRGRCMVGDKTMLDTLAPAADAFTASVEAGQPLGSAMGAAVGAAARGMRSTRPLVARRGLALRLGERSCGSPRSRSRVIAAPAPGDRRWLIHHPPGQGALSA